LAGTRAGDFSYSRDGAWIAYTTLPDGVLWRTRPDGSSRLPLTSSPARVSAFAWAPDGKHIAFTSPTTDCQNRLYVVSTEGGSAKELFPNYCEQQDPAWSPDGKYLSFVSTAQSARGAPESLTIQVLNLETNQLSPLPGSQGMRSPSWSPDGRFVTTLTEDLRKLMLLDLRTQQWSEMTQGTLFSGALKWSPNAKYLYFQDLLAADQPVYRLRLSDRKREKAMNFETYLRAGIPRCGFVDLAPDGSIIAVLLRNHADIYALDLDVL
jgi:Tol biopolymer transport system component